MQDRFSSTWMLPRRNVLSEEIADNLGVGWEFPGGIEEVEEITINLFLQ
jgi:hypothetical protein